MNPPVTSSPSYNQRRIGTLNALQLSLGLLSVDELLLLAQQADSLYRVQSPLPSLTAASVTPTML